jgi:small subunit ribosomal protein S1
MLQPFTIPAIGSVLRGQVSRLQTDCAFVRLGNGFVGTLRNPHVSWLNNRVAIDEYFHLEQVIDVVVLKVHPSSTSGFVHIMLGHKQTQPNPWDNVGGIISVGDRLPGRVVQDLLFGALVELPSGFRALVHVSELSWTVRKPKVADFLRIGDSVEVVITQIDNEQQRIQASYRQAQPNPWVEFAKLHPVGSITQGVISSRMPYGLFVTLNNGCTGLVHNTSIPNGYQSLSIGESVVVQVLEIDEANRRVALAVVEPSSLRG